MRLLQNIPTLACAPTLDTGFAVAPDCLIPSRALRSSLDPETRARADCTQVAIKIVVRCAHCEAPLEYET